MHDHTLLMIPGPVELDPEVRALLAEPLWAHYGDRWVALYEETVAQTQAVFQTNNELFLMPGPGTLGLEAALASTLGDGARALVLANGFFGHRLAESARAYGATVETVEAAWGQPLPLEAIEAAIAKHRPRVVAMVHCETSTGVLNPVEPVADCCRRSGALLVVDAISSLGAADLPVDAWGVDVCVAATQKALGCPPGLTLVSVGARAWEVMAAHPSVGWLQNLTVWRRYARDWAKWFPHPVTQNSGLVRALQLRTRRILDEGLGACFARHLAARDRLRARACDWGLKPLVTDAHAAPSVTAIALNGRIAPAELVQRLAAEHGVLIGGGLGTLAQSVVRIGHMGPQAAPKRLDRLIDALEAVLG